MACKHELDSYLNGANRVIYYCTKRGCNYSTENLSGAALGRLDRKERRRGRKERKAEWKADQEAFAPNRQRGRRS